jgi:hypothetical protein
MIPDKAMHNLKHSNNEYANQTPSFMVRAGFADKKNATGFPVA